MTFDENKARGRAAFLAGEPFDMDEGPGWQIGYGDAITIEECDPPEEDETCF